MMTAPAAATAPSPMVTPGQTMTPPPSHTWSPMVMGRPYSGPAERMAASSGWPAVNRETLGPRRQWLPMVTGATSRMVQP